MRVLSLEGIDPSGSHLHATSRKLTLKKYETKKIGTLSQTFRRGSKLLARLLSDGELRPGSVGRFVVQVLSRALATHSAKMAAKLGGGSGNVKTPQKGVSEEARQNTVAGKLSLLNSGLSPSTGITVGTSTTSSLSLN